MTLSVAGLPLVANGVNTATITAHLTRPSGQPVYGALITFQSNRAADVIAPVTVSGNAQAITDGTETHTPR